MRIQGMARPNSFPLVGREADLEAILARARAAASGRGGVLLLEGEAGIGKSSLLRDALPRIAELGLQLCHGSADILESRLPFSAIAECLDLLGGSQDPRRAALAEFICGESPPDSFAGFPRNEISVIQQIIALLENLCEAAPVALSLDNAHWADVQSLRTFGRLSRIVEQLPLLVILSIRSGDTTTELDDLRARMLERGADTISLKALPEDDVVRLVGGLVGATPGKSLRRAVAGACGNPLYVVAAVGVLADSQAIGIRAGTAEAEGPVSWESVHTTIMKRLRFLPAELLKLLRMAALLGSPFSVSALALVAAENPENLLRVLERAQRVGLLVEEGEELAFQHDLVRQALVKTLSLSVRRALHHRIGLALAEARYPVDKVAEQLRLAGSALGEAALDWLATAADRLVGRDRETAIELFGRVLSASDPADPRAQRVRVTLARALLLEGQTVRAAEVARSALADTGDSVLRTHLWWTLAHCARAETDEELSLRIAEDAAAGPDVTAAERIRFLGYASVRLFNLGRYDRAREVAERARAAAAELEPPAQAITAVAALAALAGRADRPSEALELARRVRRTGHADEQHLDECQVYMYINLGRRQDALDVVERMHEHSERRGPGAMVWSHLLSAYAQFAFGMWDDAVAEIESGQELPNWGDAHRALSAIGALISLHRADSAGAETHLKAAPIAPLYEPTDAFVGSFPRWAHARNAHCAGDPVRALELFDHLVRYDDDNLPGTWLPITAPETIRLALEVDDPARAREIHEHVSRHAENAEPTVVVPGLRWCEGLLGGDAESLRVAAELFRTRQMPWPEARCREDLAALLAGRGDGTAAERELTLAAARYQALDADWDLSRIEAALRALGVRRGVRTRRRPRSGWESLTETESKVAHLVAQGLSNPNIAARLFISRRTVQTHVSHILAKLGATSRVEIATRFAQREA
ncbi:ATP-binding protein [Amycolatopsis anabasis]|uniref:ATP-binding protein n=1 Tax=Amycolatopsis anabasis TaxID=1840409 RepID=UPI00131CA4FC|nr:AAA family ATPase [Amycolatopsis anabasis]